MSGRWMIALGVAIVAFMLMPLLVSGFYISLLNYIGIYSLVSLGLVILTGAGGLTSFGQSAFVGLGAYATAVLSTRYGLSPWLGLPCALLLSGIVAVVLGFITLHLSGHYLALLTIAWGMTIFLLFGNIDFLGGHSGINDIPPLTLFGFSLASNQRFFYLVWLLVLFAVLATAQLMESRQGRAVRALRGGNALSESLGINVFRLRLAIFILAALLAGLAGWLYAHMQRYIGPTPFDLSVGIEFLLMAVIGGAGRILGALIGAALITSLRTVLQDILPLITSRAGNLEIVVYGCLFILVLQHARAGVAGFLPAIPVRRRPSTASSQIEPLPHRQLFRDKVILQVAGLTKTFGGLVAVDDVSFEIRTGEIVGLIGPNGAGKSTIFHLISGLLPPSRGSVVFAGHDLRSVSTSHLATLGMARTFQHVKLRPKMTALENVMLGAYPRTHTGFIAGALHLDSASEAQLLADAEQQLQRVGLLEKRDELAGNLPLGQQRMLEVARSLAADPALLLLDEPAAGLRSQEKLQLSDLLKEVRRSGVTLLLVEHDMEFVMGLVDRIIMLDFGRKRAEGSPSEIRANPVVQEAYLGGVT